MRIHTYFIMSLIACLSISCLGDRKSIVGEDLGDTSFVNTDFKGNNIDYTDGMSGCDQISASDIAEIYGVSADQVVIDDPVTNPQRQVTNTPTCSFYIKSGASDFEWLRGSMLIQREIGEDEFMGDVAQATGTGTQWVEAWKLKQAMYKSSEWIPGIGQAALWNENQATLEIKLEGYVLKVHPLKNKINQEEASKNRDYKKAAIAMARAAGYIN